MFLLCPPFTAPCFKPPIPSHVNPLPFIPVSMAAAPKLPSDARTRRLLFDAQNTGPNNLTTRDIGIDGGALRDGEDGHVGAAHTAHRDEDAKFSDGPVYTGKEDEAYDKDPELADILGTCVDDPEQARSKMEERLRKKRNKILHTKTGSEVPPKVIFNKFDFSSSYIWFEFYNAPLEKDISLICDIIRAWHIIGRLGGCNSLNMQLSQSSSDKRPSYDAVRGANVMQTTFYNIGDLEVQDSLARIWVDIGTSEPLLLDVLINALTQISSDYVGIKQLVFGGTELESWKESLTTEDAGGSVHKI